MKKTTLCLFVALFFGYLAAFAKEEVPSGKLLELHDCELIAGGCIASSESTLGGRSLLRVWDFDNGIHNGQNLAGLRVALLQIANTNLAFSETQPTGSVIYLPQEATPAQQNALSDWLRTKELALATRKVEERVVPIEFVGSGDAVSLKVGQNIGLQTQSVAPAGPDHCTGMLWYSPRSRLNAFKVLVNRQSTIREKSLQLTWNNHDAKSVFLGSFGSTNPQWAANKTER